MAAALAALGSTMTQAGRHLPDGSFCLERGATATQCTLAHDWLAAASGDAAVKGLIAQRLYNATAQTWSPSRHAARRSPVRATGCPNRRPAPWWAWPWPACPWAQGMKKGLARRWNPTPCEAFNNGRGERIRTFDPLVPNQMRYQAALHPDWLAF